MEKKTLSTPDQGVKLNLVAYHMVLTTGENIDPLYQAATSNKIGLKQMDGLYGQDGARLIAAPIACYKKNTLAERIDDVLLNHLYLFIQKTALKSGLIHLHCPQPDTRQATVINEEYIQLIFNEYFPNHQLYLSYGNYLTGLLNAEKQRSMQQTEWISAAIDCQCDEQSLKALNKQGLCMTSLNDSQPAAGEAYVFLHLTTTTKKSMQFTILPPQSNDPANVQQLKKFLCEQKTQLSTLIYPELRTLDNIEHLLSIQRALWPKQKPAKGMSPYNICGDTGAASEALCLLLAVAAALDPKSSGQSLMLNSQNMAVYVEVQRPCEND